MRQERVHNAVRRGTRTRRRRAIWIGTGLAVAAALLMLGLSGGASRPPSSRPLGAGLPPPAMLPTPPVTTAVAPDATTRAGPPISGAVAAEESRLAELRTARAQLEAEIEGLRREAEERRRTMPGTKDATAREATGGASSAAAAMGGGGPTRPETTPVALPPPATPEAAPLRVFVHHRLNSRPGAAAAEEVAQTLRGAGVEVQDVRGAPFVPSTPVVRYFHEDDQAAAARLASRLGRGWAIQDFRAFVPQPPPHTLEIWLPAN